MAEDCMYEKLSENVDWSKAPDGADYFGGGYFWKRGEGTCDYFLHRNFNVWLAKERHMNPELCDDYEERPDNVGSYIKVEPDLTKQFEKAISDHFSKTNCFNGKSSIDLLNEVKSIQEQRAAEYEQDGGERSFAKIATIFNTLRGTELLPSDIALILSILKDVRLYSQEGLHRDSIIDKISYSSLWGELVMQERGGE